MWKKSESKAGVPKKSTISYRRKSDSSNNRSCSVGLNLNCRLGANAPLGTILQEFSSDSCIESEKQHVKTGPQEVSDTAAQLVNLTIHSYSNALCSKSFNDRLLKFRLSAAEAGRESKIPALEQFTNVPVKPDLCAGLEADRSNYTEGKGLNEMSRDDVINTYISYTETDENSANFSQTHQIKSIVLTGLVPCSEVMNDSAVQECTGIAEEIKCDSRIGKRTYEVRDKVYEQDSSNLDKSTGSYSAAESEISNYRERESIPGSGLSKEKRYSIDSDVNNVTSPWRTPVQTNEYDVTAGNDSYRLYKPKRKEIAKELQSTPKLSRQDFPTSFTSKGRISHHDNINEEVKKYFHKRFNFKKTSSWHLPEPSVIFSAEPWEVKELIVCKNKLNEVKEKLDDLDLKKWHSHTNMRNKAGSIIWRLRKEINPEFPTQAWCKFYENVSTFDLVPKLAISEKKLRSVHLCEAPGAFITSLNHYLKSNFDDDFDWDWLATTLNPHYEGNPLSLMINEDRFILHTMDHWVFGEDQTGDLMCRHNVDFLLRKIKARLGDVLLVTADGSIDCQDDPGEQENRVAWLHFCEAVTAMQILAKGGCYLLKIFTLFECNTVCLLYLLSCAFRKVTVNKPATSKEGNSETYVICEDYVGNEEMKPWLSVLWKTYSPQRVRKAIFPLESIPSDFIEAVVECANKFRTLQTDVIEANLQSFLHYNNNDQSRMNRIRSAVTDEFFYRYNLRSLPEKFDVVGRNIINRTSSLNMDPRMEVGTFSDKKKRSMLSNQEMILNLKKDVVNLESISWTDDREDIWWYEFKSGSNEESLLKDIELFKGKAVKCINSSKFCLGSLLNIRNKVREIVFGTGKIDGFTPESFSAECGKVPEVKRKSCIVLNFKNKLWTSSDAGLNAEEEKAAFEKIVKEFDNLMRDDDLIIVGYPLLTQFNVGLFYLLGHCFERVGLTRPIGQVFRVVFERHVVNNMKYRVKEKLVEIAENLRPYGSTVLAMLPIHKLCEGEFYKKVTLVNNLCVKEQILELIDEYSKYSKLIQKAEEKAK